MHVPEENKRRLYCKALSWLNSIDDHWMSNIDIEQMNLNLMNIAEHGST